MKNAWSDSEIFVSLEVAWDKFVTFLISKSLRNVDSSEFALLFLQPTAALLNFILQLRLRNIRS